jgi:hypothetical protein
VKAMALALILAGCADAASTVEREGGPSPVICVRKNTLDMCRDKSGAFWVCDGIKPARCIRATDPAAAFSVEPAQAEATKQ